MERRHQIRNRIIVYAARSVRSMALGMIAILVGIYLARLDFSKTAIGLIVTFGLGGGALAALAATFVADRVGRRRFLVILSIFGAAGGVVLALSSSEALIAGAAFLGMINGMGKDRGAELAVEQAILPMTASDAERTMVFGWHDVLSSAAAAGGSLMAGMPAGVVRLGLSSELGAMRLAMAVYALMMLLVAVLYSALTAEVELKEAPAAQRVSPQSRKVITRLCALFAIDSLGGGFLTHALVSFFFVARFGVGVGMVAALYFVASIANAASQVVAPLIARKIGLVNTMVFTHLPSNLMLVAVAIVPNFAAAAALFLLRECLVQMDVPTRQSYVMAVVGPAERTFAAGITSLVRLGGWAIAPAFAGLFMQTMSIGAPLVVGPVMKIAYDLLLYSGFRHLKPPEERGTGRAAEAGR